MSTRRSQIKRKRTNYNENNESEEEIVFTKQKSTKKPRISATPARKNSTNKPLEQIPAKPKPDSVETFPGLLHIGANSTPFKSNQFNSWTIPLFEQDDRQLDQFSSDQLFNFQPISSAGNLKPYKRGQLAGRDDFLFIAEGIAGKWLTREKLEDFYENFSMILSQDLLWTGLAASSTGQVFAFGQLEAFSLIRLWIKSWRRSIGGLSKKASSKKLKSAKNGRKPKGKRRRINSDSSSCDSDDEFLNDEINDDDHSKSILGRKVIEPTNPLVVYGPVGSGKTAFCRHYAERYGFTVKEISVSDGRSGRQILEQFQEASVCHHVKASSNFFSETSDFKGQLEAMKQRNDALKSSLKPAKRQQSAGALDKWINGGKTKKIHSPKRTLKAGSKTKNKRSTSSTVDLTVSPAKTTDRPVGKLAETSSPVVSTADKQTSQKSLLLIDDVDLVLAPDRGLETAVSELVDLSKRPLVLTAASLTALRRSGLAFNESAVVELRRSSETDCLHLIGLVGAAFGSDASTLTGRWASQVVSQFHRYDLRQILLRLQFALSVVRPGEDLATSLLSSIFDEAFDLKAYGRLDEDFLRVNYNVLFEEVDPSVVGDVPNLADSTACLLRIDELGESDGKEKPNKTPIASGKCLLNLSDFDLIDHDGIRAQLKEIMAEKAAVNFPYDLKCPELRFTFHDRAPSRPGVLNNPALDDQGSHYNEEVAPWLRLMCEDQRTAFKRRRSRNRRLVLDDDENGSESEKQWLRRFSDLYSFD